LFDTVTKPLIGQIEKGDKLLGLTQRDNFLPLLGIQIHSGWVMAAGMEQHHRSIRHAFEALDHPLEVQTVGLGVVVGIRLYGEASALKHAPMVLPGGVADGDLALGQQPAQILRADPKAARAAEGVNGCDPAAGDFCALGPKQ